MFRCLLWRSHSTEHFTVTAVIFCRREAAVFGFPFYRCVMAFLFHPVGYCGPVCGFHFAVHGDSLGGRWQSLSMVTHIRKNI